MQKGSGTMKHLVGALVTVWAVLSEPVKRDERGAGSGSTEALLLIGLAIAAAAIVTTAVIALVKSKAP